MGNIFNRIFERKDLQRKRTLYTDHELYEQFKDLVESKNQTELIEFLFADLKRYGIGNSTYNAERFRTFFPLDNLPEGKKLYRKASLLIHPDKVKDRNDIRSLEICNEAFEDLNQRYHDLEDLAGGRSKKSRRRRINVRTKVNKRLTRHKK